MAREKRQYVQDENGVHVMWGEFTICGDAFDIAAVDDDAEEFVTVKAQPLTCERCVALVLFCRGLKVAA